MKLNLLIETLRAKVKVVLVENLRSDYDMRDIFVRIQNNQKKFLFARNAGDKKLMKKLQDEIHYHREIAKKQTFDKRYTFMVFVKQYQREVKTTINFTRQHYFAHTHRENLKKLIEDAIGQAIKTCRFDVKVKPMLCPWHRINIERLGNHALGYVNTQENSVLKAHVKKNMQNLYDGKAPTTPKKYIGVEIEFCAPIKEEPFALKLFQKGIHKYAQLKQDLSLRPVKELKENGYELAILLEETTYKKNLKKITDLLTEIKAIVKDRRCGLHVHLDMRRRDKDLVYNNLVASQYALLSIVDPSRYNNEFCQVVKDRKIPTKFTGDRHERYKTINAAAYYKYKTLEVRMHEGSVSYDEITHWIDMLIKIANYSKKLKDDVTEVDVLQKRFKFRKPLYQYAVERSCTHQIQNDRNIQNMRHDVANLRQDNEREQRVNRPPQRPEFRIDDRGQIQEIVAPPPHIEVIDEVVRPEMNIEHEAVNRQMDRLDRDAEIQARERAMRRRLDQMREDRIRNENNVVFGNGAFNWGLVAGDLVDQVPAAPVPVAVNADIAPQEMPEPEQEFFDELLDNDDEMDEDNL